MLCLTNSALHLPINHTHPARYRDINYSPQARAAAPIIESGQVEERQKARSCRCLESDLILLCQLVAANFPDCSTCWKNFITSRVSFERSNGNLPRTPSQPSPCWLLYLLTASSTSSSFTRPARLASDSDCQCFATCSFVLHTSSWAQHLRKLFESTRVHSRQAASHNHVQEA